MKVLVATSRTQGARQNDYDWCVEGELLWAQEPCRKDRHDPDGPCGCGRGFAGMNSHRATTTARVADLDIDRTSFVVALRASLKAQGWPMSWARELADEMIELARNWPVDTVVERRLEWFRARSGAAL
jgi:hypothetical protein